MQVALAVSADGRRRVVVENRAGEVVDHQHLPLQRVLDQEGHTVQPLTLLEHTYTYAPGHGRTRDAGRQERRTQAQTCAHADMQRHGTRREKAEARDRVTELGKESRLLTHEFSVGPINRD